MTAPAIHTGHEPAPGRSPTSRGADTGLSALSLLRAVLLLFALAVTVQAALGFMGFLRAAPLVVAAALVLLLLAMVAREVRRRGQAPRSPAVEPGSTHHRSPRTAPRTAADAGLAAALAVALGERTWAGLHRTTFLYDVLSYHLHLPAAWHAAGALKIVPTPFGDPAPAYAPGNPELIYHLGLAVAGNATLAHAGQIPFAALAVLAIHATARVLGAARATGFAAALAFLLIPEVWQQATTAMADLALASFFLATIPFLLRLGPWPSIRTGRDTRWQDLMGLGLALGLLLGTKFVAAVAALPVLLWTAVVLARPGPGIRRFSALALVASLVLVSGGFWYVRNLVVTGNPLYPATLSVGPFTLAHGLYDGAAIRASIYHLPIRDLKALLEIFRETGWGYLAGFVTAAVVVVRRAPWTPWLWLALGVCLVDWLLIPYQQSRFFFSLWGVGAILLAAAAVHAPRVGALALAAATLGSTIEFPTPARLALWAAAGTGAALGPPLFAAWERLARRHGGRSLGVACRLAAVVAVGSVVCGTVAWARARTEAPVYRVGDDHDEGWAWVRSHAHGLHIAYSGSNLPFPLWGPRFENVVRYVNVSGGPDAVAHDFNDERRPVATLNAEPAPERQSPDQHAWLANLDALHVDLLFIAALYPTVERSMSHDEAGFPIERSWADLRPERFALVFANDGVRIYKYAKDAR